MGRDRLDLKEADRFPWMAPLNGNPLDWLLETNNPPVRYLTLTQILGESPDQPEVAKTTEAVWKFPPARRLLAALEDAPRDLDTLFRFGIPRGHPTIDKACRHWLNTQPDPAPGCYPEQMIGGLIRYADPADARLQAKIKFVLRNQPFADGNRPGTSLRYGARGCCCGSHSCLSAVARALWAIAGIPPANRTREARNFLRRGADFLSAHRLYKKNHGAFKPIKSEMLRLHLPFNLGWRTDVLDLLDVATQIGLSNHPSVTDALQLIISKQNDRGRWLLEKLCKNRPDLLMTALGPVETEGKESKWITLAALTQLKRCENLVLRICRGEKFDLPAQPPELPTFASYQFPRDPKDEARVRAEWQSLGMASVLDGLLEFAGANSLGVGWRWGLVMGPEHCPEWCAAQARHVPSKGFKNAWPVCRVFFMARKGQFTARQLAERLQIPLRDKYPTKKAPKWIDTTLWRIGVEKWKDEYEEVGVVLRHPQEFQRLVAVMQQAFDNF